MARKRSRPRHPPLSPLEQLFTGIKDTVLDFVEDAAYDLQEVLLAQQEEAQRQARSRVPPGPSPSPGKRPRTGRNPVVAPIPPTHYSVLGVAPTAPMEVIQAAYRALSRVYHPDVPGTGNAEKMKRINAAHEVVGDVKKRKEYDRGLR